MASRKKVDAPEPVVESMPDAAPEETGRAVRFQDDGVSFIYGVPARDLTADEWHALSDEERSHLLASGLYEEI